MNKTDLSAAMAESTGLSKKDCEKALNAAVDIITATLVSGEKVQLSGFGTFETKAREAHAVLNPRTGERMEIAPGRVATFKAGKVLKERIRR